MEQVFKCDPEKNVACKKNDCFMNGGSCKATRHLEFAKQPLESVTFVMSAEEAKPILEAIGEDDKKE